MFGGLVGAADAAGAGVLMAGAGVLVRLAGTTWKLVNSVKASGGGSNGTGEWRGRVEQILDHVVKVQDRSNMELSELRRATDRMTTVAEGTSAALERVANLLDAHDRRTAAAAAVIPLMGDQVEALYRKEFGR
jgi:hypothetical protein